MARVRPDVIVNCAAYNDVDGAEDHPVDALNVNAFAVRALARAAPAHGATLVHYSTDFVFDGTATRPVHRRRIAPNPQSVYAASKLLGEWFARRRAARATCCASRACSAARRAAVRRRAASRRS